MANLHDLMVRSEVTQRALQEWDKKQGLPKSHSHTMVNTSRSRQQLQEGKILPKWDGSPLIKDDEVARRNSDSSAQTVKRGSREPEGKLR